MYVANCEKTVECLLSSMRFIASYVHAIATYVCICAIISDSLVDLSHIHMYVRMTA